MGRIICMLDPAEVAARDASMKEAMANPALALKPPPEPRLGDSAAFQASDPHAGYLSLQGRVSHAGREGLFDDVVGRGWQLLVRGDGATPAIDKPMRAALRRIGGVVADFGPQGGTLDLDGSYAAWFDRLDTKVVLVRPDFYIFGTASSPTQLSALLAAAETLLGTVPA
jgi:hypothetical protein